MLFEFAMNYLKVRKRENVKLSHLNSMSPLHTFTLSCFLFFSFSAYAQLKKANSYFDKYEYAKAIGYYEKELSKKDSSETFEKLATCYFFTGDYEKAETMYSRLLSRKDAAPINFFNYGRILQYNGKYAEAKNQFLKYSLINPDDKRGELFAKSCDIHSWKDSLFGVEIINLSKINSSFAEFSPFRYDNRIFFVSDRPKDFIDYDKQNWTSTPFTAIYAYRENAKDNSDYSIHLFEKLNTDGHNGPISFSEQKNRFYFMRIEQEEIKNDEDKINKGKIFEGKIEHGKISGLSQFPYNNDNYSCGHPGITPDGEFLFFTSDMPGGFGGKDIYYSKKENESWGKPVNLGKEINTEGDEVFPSAVNDSLFYFSSNGHPGYGGLDIFSAYKTKEGWKPVHLKMPVNSNDDDYGIYFSSKDNGYFSSDRKGGKGHDDIYEFKMVSSSISGELLSADNKPKKGMKLYLLNQMGVTIDSAITNDAGFFVFKKLQHDQNYIVMIKGSDVDFKGYASYDDDGERALKFYIANKRNIIVDSIRTDKEKFLSYIPKKVNLVDIKGKILLGTLPGMMAPGVGVLLKSEDGTIISSAVTGKDGTYEFKSLPGDGAYMIVLDESNPSFNANTKYIILGNLFSKGLPLLKGDVQLWFGDKFDEKLVSMVLDKDGLYRFEYLPAEHYAVRLKNATNVEWEKIDVNLNDENKTMVIIENIYFETDKWDILSSGEKVLDKAILFLKSHPEIILELGAHTDSRASDEYNLELSQKRAQSAVQYMVSKGIAQSQLKAVGYGESRLLNKCNNHVTCSEEEHKINRRMEFKIIRK